MVETIFLDLDDTLLDFTRSEAAALSRAFREVSLPATSAVLERYHAINAAQWELLEEGKLTREQVLTRRFELLFSELGEARDPLAVCERYESYLAESHDMIPGASELLEELSRRYPLYLASNGASAVQHSRLQRAGMERYFRKIFISEELGVDKPSAEFFARCFAAVPNGSPQTALMVGDSLTSDIRGGKRAGMQTCWFNPHGRPGNPQMVPDYEIASLPDLSRLLKEIGSDARERNR